MQARITTHLCLQIILFKAIKQTICLYIRNVCADKIIKSEFSILEAKILDVNVTCA